MNPQQMNEEFLNVPCDNKVEEPALQCFSEKISTFSSSKSIKLCTTTFSGNLFTLDKFCLQNIQSVAKAKLVLGSLCEKCP